MPELSEEELAAEAVCRRAGVNQPGFKSLVAHMQRFGPEGILESAAHLSDEAYNRLAEKCRRMKFDRKGRRWITNG